MEQFTSLNLNSCKTKIVMSDKDQTERNSISTYFSQAKKIICLFHTMQIFKRTITKSHFSLSDEVILENFDLIKNLVQASSVAEFEEIHTKFEAKAAEQILEYYRKNWHPCKEEWAICYTKQNTCFGTRTNNRLENLNKRLKTIIERYSTLPDFIENFFFIRVE